MDEVEIVDVLAVGAHPDDVELGCGGALASLVRQGRSVGILDLTRGEAATRGTPQIRARESAASAQILGARFRVTLDLGDGNLRVDREAELQVIDVVRRSQPRLVFAPLPADRHPDHERASRLTSDSSFYAGLRSLKTGVAPHRPQQVIFYPNAFLPSPSFLVDISSVLATKLQSIKAYSTQFYDPESGEPETFISSKNFYDAIAAQAQAYGRLAGVTYAEGFVTLRPPMLQDLFGAFEGYEPGFGRDTP